MVSALGTDSTKTAMGRKIIFEGNRTSCGASFIANQSLAFADTGGIALGKEFLTQLILDQPTHEFAERFLLRSQNTDEVIRNGEYEIYKNGHLVLRGHTDEDGMTQLISGMENDEIEIHITDGSDDNG